MYAPACCERCGSAAARHAANARWRARQRCAMVKAWRRRDCNGGRTSAYLLLRSVDRRCWRYMHLPQPLLAVSQNALYHASKLAFLGAERDGF